MSNKNFIKSLELYMIAKNYKVKISNKSTLIDIENTSNSIFEFFDKLKIKYIYINSIQDVLSDKDVYFIVSNNNIFLGYLENGIIMLEDVNGNHLKKTNKLDDNTIIIKILDISSSILNYYINKSLWIRKYKPVLKNKICLLLII